MTKTHRLRNIYTLSDYEKAAKRYLPKAVFQYIRNGAGDEYSLRRDRQVFNQWRWLPHRLRDVTARDPSVELFGHRYAQPFGIAPTGGAAVIRYNADRLEAVVTRAANIPYMLSANSITPLEDIIAINPDAWFAAYFPHDPTIIYGVTDRAHRAGYKVLMVTIDVPVAARRIAETKAGYTMPIRPNARVTLNAIRHPSWLLGLARTVARRPVIANIQPEGGPSLFSRGVDAIGGASAFTWEHIKRLRERWPGALVLKGILRADDAAQAAEIGVDGIVISNHGARLMDHMVSPAEMIAEIKAASGTMTVLADGGFRNGSDVLTGLALGADAILLGRPFLFSCALAGRAGVEHATEMLRQEILRNMGMLGVTDLTQLSPDLLRS
ncbi:alpha-hydroxy acid oxidase [Kozakia baliensis]|uniref:alpha-hydroxy acid oxidase n=1 Tax=Kozakia baliensis TaxID=153496 RepID=UPI00055CD5F9|nr:alpha-hydroxy acid oxidase [Kozakia baliensis]